MTKQNLDEVRERARDIFVYRAPMFLRFGEGVLKAVDAVTGYAYREGKQAGRDEHQDRHHEEESRGRIHMAVSDNRGLLSNLMTLALSGTAAAVATPAVGPLISASAGWGLVVLVAVVLLVRAFWGAK